MPDNSQVNNIKMEMKISEKEILLVVMEVITMLVMFTLVQVNNYPMTMNNTQGAKKNLVVFSTKKDY